MSQATTTPSLDITQSSNQQQHLTTDELSSSGIDQNKIKFVKKSVPPHHVQLVRGPDIIETIETTTSMSFIVNKNVKLTYEEKRIPAEEVVDGGGQYDEKEEEREWSNVNSTPIPIVIQSRSWSEPRRVENDDDDDR